MNILFLTDHDCVPQNGGIERLVSTLSDGFYKKGINCFLLYAGETLTTDPAPFVKKFQLNKDHVSNQLRSIIRDEKIDLLFSHYMTKSNRSIVLPCLTNLKTEFSNLKHVALYHSEPGIELVKSPLSIFFNRISKGIDVKENLDLLAKQILLRILGKKRFTNIIKPKYRLLFDSADALVLLDSSYFSIYNNIIGNDGVSNKYHAIGNPLTYDEVGEIEFESKKQNVLIVSRLEEQQKRLSKAFDIWSKVENSFPDWTLSVLGDGPDKQIYESRVRKNHSKNVFFLGKKDPKQYYKESSIFLMTSDYEGWGLTLTEAMQHGCVPIVFNTYGAASTIINSGVDGVLISKDDDNAYTKALYDLMTNKEMRISMGQSAMSDCNKFSKDKTIERWIDLFSSL